MPFKRVSPSAKLEIARSFKSEADAEAFVAQEVADLSEDVSVRSARARVRGFVVAMKALALGVGVGAESKTESKTESEPESKTESEPESLVSSDRADTPVPLLSLPDSPPPMVRTPPPLPPKVPQVPQAPQKARKRQSRRKASVAESQPPLAPDGVAAGPSKPQQRQKQRSRRKPAH